MNNYYRLSNIHDIDEHENYEENTTFSDKNEDFIEFKSNVSEWLTLDDDIETLKKAIKERNKKKNELTSKITEYMNKFEINDLNTNNGKLKFSKSLYTKPLNKNFLISRLGDYFKDYNKGEKAASFLLENRDKEEKFRLRRVKNKHELQL